MEPASLASALALPCLPEVYGIETVPFLGCEPRPGLIAISASVLRGLYDPTNPFRRPPAGCYDWLLEREPIAWPGYSIHVYEIPEEEVPVSR